MADLDDLSEAQRFHADVPAVSDGFHVKGAGHLDWGMQRRLANIFSPGSGRTVMLAFDHGYFQGPTSGLERLDLQIAPLAPYADAIMCTRGALRTSISPSADTSLVLRASGGPSMLKELSDEHLALDVVDAVRLDADALAVQVFIGGEHESRTVQNMTRLIDAGARYGIPVLGVTAVGRELTRDARYLRMACRIIAELGAQMVKTYYCPEDFETITASCPVPVIMAGGKKLPELDALKMAEQAIAGGAAGVDMGRNVFQSDNPLGMLAALRAVVHESARAEDAYDLYRTGQPATVD